MINIFVSKAPQTFDFPGSVETFKTGFPLCENEKYLDDILRRKNESSRNLSLHALCVLARGLSALGIETKSLILKRTQNGKPYFENSTVYFSISHDKNFVCVAVSDRNVGVDMQSGGDSLRCDRIADRYFTEIEKEQIKNGEISSLSLWTRKEAYAKLSDTPLSQVINSPLPSDAVFKNISWQNFMISLASYEFDEIYMQEI